MIDFGNKAKKENNVAKHNEEKPTNEITVSYTHLRAHET